MSFAAYSTPRTGKPWDPHEDRAILADKRAGTLMWVIAQRARRTEQEVEDRLKELESQRKG